MRFLSFFALLSTAAAAVVNYPRASFYPESEEFSLTVGGKKIDTVNFANNYDYAHLAMDAGSPVEFRLKAKTQKSITSYILSPRGQNFGAKISGNELVFSASKPQYFIILINKVKEMVILVDPIEKDVPKDKGDGIFNVLDYKADNSGKAITKGIQDAADAAAKKPGSIVYVPAGSYLMGNLMLKSFTSLYLAPGAALRFTGNRNDYKTLFTKAGLFDGTWWIQTEPASDGVKIYGRGTIDGNGKYTRSQKYMASLVVPVGTKNFKYDGVLVRDGSFWAVTPIQAKDVEFTNLKILNRHDVTQDDGIDVVESQRVTVKRSIAIANDDSYSCKTWEPNLDTTKPYPFKPQVVKDIVFDDCMSWTECYSFKIGQGVVEDQSNVLFKNGVVYNAGVGMGVHHLYGSKTASNITFDTIDVENLHGNSGGIATWLALHIKDNGNNRGVGPIKDVTVKNIRARVKGTREGLIQGWSDKFKVSGVTFSNVFMGDSKTPATTLKEMNMVNTSFSEGIKFANTK
jgi:polygalacturonase